MAERRRASPGLLRASPFSPHQGVKPTVHSCCAAERTGRCMQVATRRHTPPVLALLIGAPAQTPAHKVHRDWWERESRAQETLTQHSASGAPGVIPRGPGTVTHMACSQASQIQSQRQGLHSALLGPLSPPTGTQTHTHTYPPHTPHKHTYHTHSALKSSQPHLWVLFPPSTVTSVPSDDPTKQGCSPHSRVKKKSSELKQSESEAKLGWDLVWYFP